MNVLRDSNYALVKQQSLTPSREMGYSASPTSPAATRPGVQAVSFPKRGAITQLRRQRSKLALAREKQRTRMTTTRGAHSTVLVKSTLALESVQEDCAYPAPTRVPSPKLMSTSSIGGFSQNAPKDDLLKSSPDELVQAILSLRIENKDFYKVAIPPRTSSQPNEQSTNLPTIIREQRTGQQCDLQSDLALATKRVAELESKLERESMRAKKAEEKVDRLPCVEEQLAQERAKAAEAEKQAKRTLKELASVTRTEGNLYDDNHFREEVTSLRYSIDNWVRNQSWQVVDKQSPPDILKAYQFLKKTCPSSLDYIRSSSGLRALVHSHIWVVLGSQVFGRNVWAESRESKNVGPEGRNTTSNPFSAWQDYIEKTIDMVQQEDLYHEWRVANARLMATRNSVAIIRAVEKETRRLTLDLDNDLKEIVETDIDVPGLEDLFHDAVKLDALIQQQRPQYMFYPFTQKRLEFDPSIMDATNQEFKQLKPDSPKQVKLVVQPGFVKYGNSAGRNYDRGHSLLTATVELF